MKEKEKMVAGQLYNANDFELVAMRNKAKDLCFKFNQHLPSDYPKDLLRSLLPNQGQNIYITAPFYCDYGFNIEIGDNFYANHNLVILDVCKVKIGNNVLIGPNCGLYAAAHPIDVEKRASGLEFGKPITIGDNVWLGGNVVVCGGVTIGSNTVVGAGSVVVGDLPDNVLAVGNPCRIIRKLN